MVCLPPGSWQPKASSICSINACWGIRKVYDAGGIMWREAIQAGNIADLQVTVEYWLYCTTLELGSRPWALGHASMFASFTRWSGAHSRRDRGRGPSRCLCSVLQCSRWHHGRVGPMQSSADRNHSMLHASTRAVPLHCKGSPACRTVTCMRDSP